MSGENGGKSAARDIGAAGEDRAANFLAAAGYRIITRNFHSRLGEIDIIAQKDAYIVFVEVKARKNGSMVGGIEAVSISKQRKIIKTALFYMGGHRCNLQPRFDIIEVLPTRINHLQNAFDAEGVYGF
ncbi:MAG: YraN family protein [Oscillospiraceae bacterium]|nr:YraN family protein [Oscillospiraceae bacterium]